MITTLSLPFIDYLNVDIEESVGFLDTSDYTLRNDAIVSLLSNDSSIVDFTYNDSIGGYISNTSLLNIPLNEGAIYRLNVEIDNKVFNINDTLPIAAENISDSITLYAGIDEDGFIKSMITITFKDNPDYNNYYEIQLRNSALNEETNYYITSDDPSITTESYYPTNFSSEVANPKYLPFSDELFNGETKQINVYYTPTTNNDGTKVKDHVVNIIFKTTSQAYYNYRTSLIQQSYSNMGNILYGIGEPISVYSNIDGGLGIFAAASQKIITEKIITDVDKD